MTDLNIALRLRVNNDGLVQVLDASTEKVEQFGRKGKRAGEQASEGMEKATRSGGMLTGALGRLTLAATGAFAAVFSINTASTAFGAVIDNTITAERALTQLEARVVSTGSAANRTTEQLVAQAAALQDLSIFGDETIQTMQSVLLTFTQIQDVNFDRATASVLDIATVMGTDLQSAALQVGKALNDPKRGLDGLQRSGIQFNETQKELITNLVETGNVAAAQSVILEELERQFGGAAQAARTTLGGSIDSLRNSFGDLLEFRGDLPALSASIEELTNSLKDPELAASIQSGLGALLQTIPPALELTVDVGTRALQVISLLAENWEILEVVLFSLAGVITGRLITSIAAKISLTNIATAASIRYRAALAAVSSASSIAATTQVALAGATRAATVALRALGGPLGIALGVAGAIAAISGSTDSAAASFTSSVDDANSLGGSMLTLEERVLSATGAMEELNRLKLTELRNEAINDLELVQSEIQALENRLSSFGPTFDESGFPTVDALAAIDIRDQLEQLREQEAELTPIIDRINESIASIGQPTNEGGLDVDALEGFTEPLLRQADALREQLVQLSAGEAALNAWRDARILATAAQMDAEAGTTAYTAAAREQLQQIQALRDAVQSKTEQRQAEVEAERAAEQAATALLNLYTRMQAEVDPLAAQQAELNEQIEIFENALNLSEAELEEMGVSADTVRLILDQLYLQFEQLGEVDLSEANRYLDNLQDQLEAVQAGPRALREYNAELQIKNDLEALGLGNLEELTDEQRALREEIIATTEAMQTANQFQDLFSSIGQGISTAVLNGSSLSDALGQSLTAGGAQFLSEGIQEAISRGLTRAFETFDISAAGQQRIADAMPGVALGIGQALQGQVGQGIGSAVGAIAGSFIPGIGTALGSVLGGLLGGLFDGGGVPKFQISGDNTAGGRDLGISDTVEGPLGGLNFGFREIEDEARQQIIKAFVQFDTSLAAVIGDQDLLASVTAALDDYRVSSRSDSESIEVLLQERLRVALTAFDRSVQTVVLERNTLEEQFQALADVQAIRDAIDNVRGLGLEFDATLNLVNELAGPGESLGNAFIRLREGMAGVNTLFGVLGFTVEGTQEGLLRYVDSLTEAAGGIQELDRQFNRFWDTFVNDATAAQQDVLESRERATSLLGQLGLDASLIDDPDAFRETFSDLLPTLSPEDAALLLQISDAIADVIDAEEALAQAREEALRPTRELAGLLAEAQEAILRADLSPFQNELVSIRVEGLTAAAAMNAAAEAAGMSASAADGLADVHELTERRIRQAIARLEDAGRGLVGQLFGNSLDDLNARISELQGGAEGAASALSQATRNLSGFADSLLIGDLSPLNQGDQLEEARRQQRRAAAAGDGDEVQRLSQIILQIARDRFASGADFRDIFDDQQRILRGFQGREQDVQTVRNPELESLIRERDAIEAEQRAQQQVSLGRELAQVVADLAQARDLDFEAIAESLNFDLSALGDVLGLDTAGLEDFLDSLQVDTLDVAETVFNLEQALTDQLVAANTSLTDIADSVRVFRVPEGPQPPPGGVPGPTPPGGGQQPPGPGLPPPGDDQIPRELVAASNNTTTAVEQGSRSIVEAVMASLENDDEVLQTLRDIEEALRAQPRGSTDGT